jgi:hypothetical protein
VDLAAGVMLVMDGLEDQSLKMDLSTQVAVAVDPKEMDQQRVEMVERVLWLFVM